MNDQGSVRAAGPIDTLPRAGALSVMLRAHIAAAAAVEGALTEIDAAASLLADAIKAGAQASYAAAGSSGLMALADMSELRGTFGIPQDQVRIVMAGGVPADGSMPGDTEDCVEDARAAAALMGTGDIAIVLSASGTTPFALAFAEMARSRGAKVIGIATATSAPLLDMADVAIALPVAPEVVDGSTRLGAGTAQKVALNLISTQAGILLGHVHDGMMVNLIADNAKLRKRAAGIVSEIARVSGETAKIALDAADGDTKLAILIAKGADPEHARAQLGRHEGRLPPCLAQPPEKQRN